MAVGPVRARPKCRKRGLHLSVIGDRLLGMVDLALQRGIGALLSVQLFGLASMVNEEPGHFAQEEHHDDNHPELAPLGALGSLLLRE
jgi:hypothetical protein